MTIQELITLLEAIPDKSTRVIVRGYEAGYNDIAKLEPLKLSLNQNSKWYYGKHDVVPDYYDELAIHISA